VAGCVLLRTPLTSDGNIIFNLFFFDLMKLGHKTSEGCTSFVPPLRSTFVYVKSEMGYLNIKQTFVVKIGLQLG